LAAAERNVRDCVFGQQNQDKKWGDIPVVLLFGDDYQLFPVADEGAISGFAKKTKLKGVDHTSSTYKSPSEQLLINRGHDLFMNDLTQNVFHLKTNYRSRSDPEYSKILADLRTGVCDEKGGERLMAQCMHHHDSNPAIRDFLENHEKTIFLYPQNYQKNIKNMEKIVQLSNDKKVPIARLQCEWSSTKQQSQGIKSVYRSHFSGDNMVLHTDICVGATVSICGINIVPEAGLYNGARGTVVDIIYDTVEGPNNKQEGHLPRYVVVNFPGLKLGDAEPWDKRIQR